jgi:hypothetical protein
MAPGLVWLLLIPLINFNLDVPCREATEDRLRQDGRGRLTAGSDGGCGVELALFFCIAVCLVALVGPMGSLRVLLLWSIRCAVVSEAPWVVKADCAVALCGTLAFGKSRPRLSSSELMHLPYGLLSAAPSLEDSTLRPLPGTGTEWHV